MLTFMIHQMIATLFIIIIPLPIIALLKSRSDGILPAAPLWKVLVMLANLALFISLITGFMLFPVYTSVKVWISVALILALGAFLGIFSKQLKLYKNEESRDAQLKTLQKIGKVGFGYIAIVIATYVLMFNWYNL